MINYKKIWAASPILCQWCDGCGDFGELKVLRDALAELEIQPKDVLIVGGIGCAGQMPQYVPSSSLKMPHGRVLPAAIAAHVGNPKLTILGQGGDGDAFAIGGGHYVNAPGWNADITYIVTNNEVYGLTKGQLSPTALPQLKTKANPDGPIKNKMNPIAVALGAKWTFIARLMNVGKTKDGLETGKIAVEILKKAILHKGSSLVIFETACPTYNKLKTSEWLRQKAVAIETLNNYYPNGYDPKDSLIAYQIATEIYDVDKIPVGIYYQIEKPTLLEKLQIDRSLTNAEIGRKEIKKIMQEFK